MNAVSPFSAASRTSKFGFSAITANIQRAIFSAPWIGRSAAFFLPPPSLISTASGASSDTTWSKSPDPAAAMNRMVSSS
jgi:hypothetical protein